jgi:hypothetical protein
MTDGIRISVSSVSSDTAFLSRLFSRSRSFRRFAWSWLLRPLLTPCSARIRTGVALSGASCRRRASPRRGVSPGKNADLRRTTAGYTTPKPWSRELRSHLPARPARHRLRSSSCPSARSFAARFLHAVLADRRSADRFARHDQLTKGLLPPSQRPCRAHKIGPPLAGPIRPCPEARKEHTGRKDVKIKDLTFGTIGNRQG